MDDNLVNTQQNNFLKEKLKALKIIEESAQKNWGHVFLVNNPIAAIVSRAIIDEYSINIDNVFAISLRNTETSICGSDTLIVKEYLIDRIIFKLFKYNIKSHRIRRLLEKKYPRFILYTSWYYPEAKIINSSSQCIGHAYIEEGWASYRKLNTFSQNKHGNVKSLSEDKVKYAENNDNLFRDDAFAFFGLHKDSFPLIDQEQRFILSGITNLKKYYKPYLLGIKCIGLTCALRRIDQNKIEDMLAALINHMPDGGVIKLHPSFIADSALVSRIQSIINRIAPDTIKLCDNSAIIEMEMLYESKTIIGPLSSLIKYTEIFESKYQHISLY